METVSPLATHLQPDPTHIRNLWILGRISTDEDIIPSMDGLAGVHLLTVIIQVFKSDH